MSKLFIASAFYLFFLIGFTVVASAKEKVISGQNAFTRAVQKPLEDIVTPVENNHLTMCNSVIECRKYGGDLETKWQLNNSTDFSPKDYPDNCYVLGEGGKYHFSQASCANIKP